MRGTQSLTLAVKSAQVRYSPDAVQQGTASPTIPLWKWFLSGYQTPITEVGTAAFDLIDIACIGSATANLKWYENLGAHPK